MDVQRLLVLPEQTIRQVIGCIDRGGQGIALVVDNLQRLLGTVTDGDIRRAMLAGMDLELPVNIILTNRAKTAYPQPITAATNTLEAELLRLMNKHTIRHIPLLDECGAVVGIALLSELVKEYELPITALVMAGGMGTRLRPLTEDLPKPMLPVGDRPLLELILDQLRQTGIQQVNIATHYKPEKITDHFGDGRNFGIDIRYVAEEQPLGTAGALGLMQTPDQPVLMMNGDILTRVNFKQLYAFHREHQADLTVGVRLYQVQVPYGVVESDGVHVCHLVEKPLYNFFVNAGIYLLEPAVYDYIPYNRRRFDMPELIATLLADGRQVVSFPVREYWLDIGQHADYLQAQEDVRNGVFG